MHTGGVQTNFVSFGAGVVLATILFAIAHNFILPRIPSGGVSDVVDWNFVGYILGCGVLAAAIFALMVYAAPYFPTARNTGLPGAKAATHHSDASQSMRAELETQLGRFMLLIAQQLDTSKNQVQSLDDANNQLARASSADDLKVVIAALSASNQRAIAEAARLQEQLKDAQYQATDLQQRLSYAERLASLDSLTAIANRRRFEAVLQREVQHSHADGTPLCVVMADIDHFKSVNDTYGHAAGDRVLIKFAEVLSQQLRSTDLVARYGGEEFAIVLPRTPMGNAFDVAERVRTELGKINWGEGDKQRAIRLSASFGVAEIREGEFAENLVKRADEKLYEAKTTGRNRTVIWGSAS